MNVYEILRYTNSFGADDILNEENHGLNVLQMEKTNNIRAKSEYMIYSILFVYYFFVSIKSENLTIEKLFPLYFSYQLLKIRLSCFSLKSHFCFRSYS